MKSVRTKTRERLQRKIDILHNWALVGVPIDKKGELPKSVTQFAAWTDDGLGLEAIPSPNAVSANGPNRELIKEAVDLIKALRVPIRKATPQAEKASRLTLKLAESERRVRELTGAWHMARELAAQREIDCVSYKTRVEDLEAENAQLRRHIDQVVPLRNAKTRT